MTLPPRDGGILTRSTALLYVNERQYLDEQVSLGEKPLSSMARQLARERFRPAP